MLRFILKDDYLIPEWFAQPDTGVSPAPLGKIPCLKSPIINPLFTPSLNLRNFLQGKQLLLDEIPFELALIHEHYMNGYVTYRKGVVQEKGLVACNRCGNRDQELFGSFHCARCGDNCRYCRKCIMMGRVSECTPLISWTETDFEFVVPERVLHWDGSLSKGQKAASDEVVKAIQQNSELLVWAVCGAGKTEVLFHGIASALQAGKRVCIATPRTDVVIELAPRIKSAFPEIDVIALYGGSEDRSASAPLTISTTHQLLRYYKAFDVLIIDEVDAFPYSMDEMLQFAVERAKKEESSTIYLSATPDKTWQRDIAKGKRRVVTIPARFHGHPLPVPKFVWCGNWRKGLEKKRLPRNVLAWIREHLQSSKQAFLFVPDIKLMGKIVTILQTNHPQITGVHSADPERKEKVAAFRRGEIPILVTTTILERGVTVPNIDVAVLGSEDDIFTESALVQISGRVGRSSQYPDGEIIFFHYGKTNEMIRARKQILKMNTEGEAKGYLPR